MTVFDIISRYREGFLQGLSVTLQLSMITWISGLLLGSLLGPLAYRWPASVGITLRVIAFLISGVPFLVLLYWAHFPLQTLLGLVIDPFITAASLLSFLNTIIVAEVWRGALSRFRQEYVLAAHACGLTTTETLWRIQLPIIAREAIPLLIAVQVAMLQMTLFASLISVEELFRVAQRINSSIHKPVEIYTALALFFIAICTPLYFLAYWLRRRYSRDLSYR